MFLHAAKLALPHPITGDALVLESPLPPELRNFLTTLDRHERHEHGEAF
jgi:23S rRNA pseudouridine955/2504/2580 synthase